jgi:hypothetical protein
LQDEVKQLKAKLRYQERKEKEGFFSSSTPSSKIPVKENTPEGADSGDGEQLFRGWRTPVKP